MAKGWVTVLWASTCDVCVNGNYTPPAAGQTNLPFRVETGPNTFEVVTTPAGPQLPQIVAAITEDIGPSSRAEPTILNPQPLDPPVSLPRPPSPQPPPPPAPPV